ncbi:PH domain-containing protein [Nonlabens xiamenensis]|uniref:PH domain-containing protein n=1 Tax=Nonlabens xiamenensis TaxID=2341043 RepID=UPI001F0BD26E|nr:PH domain-containing protein [Nonlabens xiamenensis]
MMTNQTIDVPQLPSVESSSFQKHPKRFLNKKLIAKTLLFIPLLATVVVPFFAVEEEPWIWKVALVLWLVLLLLTIFMAYKEYFVRGYVLREHDITYRKGWLFHHQTTVPFNRIQHTEINHGPIDRMFTLCELEIFTAGGSSSDLSISGLDPVDAQKLKEYISSKTSTYA